MIPEWLHLLSLICLGIGAVCAMVIAFDLVRHPQHMWIMNVVWPITALFGSVLVVWQYFRYGRLAEDRIARAAMEQDRDMPSRTQTPFPMIVANGALHCGSGCTLGDICAEWLVFLVPTIAVWFGWHSLFADKIFATWIIDFLVAFAFGVVFQYFTIKPMRDLSVGQGIWQAIKVDCLSLASWQIGMYGFMAFADFYLFGTLLGTRLRTDTASFWFMMQLAMLCGFATAYPVNWWLIRSGVKEAM